MLDKVKLKELPNELIVGEYYDIFVNGIDPRDERYPLLAFDPRNKELDSAQFNLSEFANFTMFQLPENIYVKDYMLQNDGLMPNSIFVEQKKEINIDGHIKYVYLLDPYMAELEDERLQAAHETSEHLEQT